MTHTPSVISIQVGRPQSLGFAAASEPFDKPWTTADRAALLVGDIFRGPRVALPVHLRDCTTELGLLWSEQHDALNVAVDEVVIIILLKELGSRMTKDSIPLLGPGKMGMSAYSSAPCYRPLRFLKSITATSTSLPPSGFRITKRSTSP